MSRFAATQNIRVIVEADSEMVVALAAAEAEAEAELGNAVFGILSIHELIASVW